MFIEFTVFNKLGTVWSKIRSWSIHVYSVYFPALCTSLPSTSSTLRWTAGTLGCPWLWLSHGTSLVDPPRLGENKHACRCRLCPKPPFGNNVASAKTSRRCKLCVYIDTNIIHTYSVCVCQYVFKGKQAPLLDQAKSSKSCFCKILSVKFASQPRQSICSCDSTGCLPGLNPTRTKDLTVPVGLLENNFCRPAC